MSLTLNGSSLVFNGTVTISNLTNPAAGVCTLTLTPSGGVGNIPALVDGTPGLPALINSFTVNTLTPGSTGWPNASGTLTQTSAGGPGQSSTYSLTLNVPQGATGSSGSFALHNATDLSGTAAVGNMVTVSSVSSNVANGFTYTPFPYGNVFTPSTITSQSTSGRTSATLCSIQITPSAWPTPTHWYPLCFASATFAGTTSTAFQLQALLGSPSSGAVLGTEYGVVGSTTQRLSMLPSFGSPQSGALVAAGASAQIYLVASQTASVPDSWSISNATVSFTVVAVPVP